jgi:hypothetical protein
LAELGQLGDQGPGGDRIDSHPPISSLKARIRPFLRRLLTFGCGAQVSKSPIVPASKISSKTPTAAPSQAPTSRVGAEGKNKGRPPSLRTCHRCGCFLGKSFNYSGNLAKMYFSVAISSYLWLLMSK